MRIGIEAQRLFRERKHGMEVVALETIRELQKLTHSHEIVVFVKEDNHVCITSNDTMEVVQLPSSPYPVWEQLSLRKALNKHKVDLIHCTANTAPLFLKKNLILTLHDIIYLESVSFSGSAYQNFGNLYRRFIVPKIVDQCSFIITVSNYEKECISSRLDVNPEKIKVVYNAINPSFKVYEDESLSRIKIKYDLPERFILHFGNTAQKKNTIGTLKAFAELKTSEKHKNLYLVITDCKEDYIDNILQGIKSKNIKPYIKILDYVPFIEVPFLYNLATVFMYPSLRESFGMPVLEAMACGTPVVTSNTSSMPEISGEAAVLVNPYDPFEIASNTDYLLSNSKYYSSKIEEGIIQSEKFNWTNTAKEILTIYNDISI